MQSKFMHIADVHLGYKQYGSETRFNDFARAFDHAVEKGLEADVDFVLLCGDLFHKSAIDPPTLLQAVNRLERLRQAEIPVVAVTGNHDRARYRDPFRRSWLDYLAERGHLILLAPTFGGDGTLFSPWDGNQGGYVDLKGVRILGLPYLGSTLDTILDEVPDAIANLDTSGIDFTILLGHFGLEGEVPGVAGGVSHNLIAPLRQYVDYLALGHLHKPFERQGWVYNPGSLEVCGMDERDWEGGVYLVTTDASKTPKHTAKHIPILRRPFHRWYFEVQAHLTPEALYDALTEFLKEQKRNRPSQDLDPVVELSLEGVLAFDRAALDTGRIQDILEQIVAPLVPRLRNNARATEFEIAPDDHRSRHELEREVILDLVRRDGRYRERAEFWAGLIQEIKNLALSNRPPDEIVAALRQRPSDEG
ncbi:MAG: hypothetical protein GTO14_17045 [Anaerolineales bacterium]|nr:hypothetical protein [Anaerolineales bacterium]